MDGLTVSDTAIVGAVLAFVGKMVWEFFTSGKKETSKIDERLDKVVDDLQKKIQPISDKISSMEISFTKAISDSEVTTKEYTTKLVTQLEKSFGEQVKELTEKLDARIEKIDNRLREEYVRKQELDMVRQMFDERMKSLTNLIETVKTNTQNLDNDLKSHRATLQEFSNRLGQKGV